MLLSLSLIAAACGGDDGDPGEGATDTTAETGGGGTTDATEASTGDDDDGEPVRGGTLVVGAEQEPDCADWIASCAGASWGTWTMQAHTMPRAFDFADGEYRPSNILAGEPELVEGPPQTVTYRIADNAVWSDGEPITSTDFRYTFEQIRDGDDIYSKVEYADIQSVDDSDPKVAVVTFSQPYAGWRDLFGAFFGIFPSHILQGQNRNAAMKDGYTWSGGPWKIETWTKGQEVRLIPNENYFGTKPNLDALVFRFIPDSAAEASAYRTGQVRMINPQAQLELAELRNVPDTEFMTTTSLSYEAVWFNTEKPPLDSKAVRQALAFSTDRQAVVDALFKPVQDDIAPIHSFATPANEQFYVDPFSRYERDLDQVNTLMEGDGWAKGGDGIWAKGGQRAAIEISTTAGNRRRELTQQLLQSQWREAGFELTINNTAAGTLFGEWGPQGVFQSALFAQVPPSTDPEQCSVFCADSVPTAENGGSGNNWTRIRNPQITEALQAVNTTLDEDDRKEAFRQAQEALAEEVPALPVDPFPDVVIYNDAVIKGPVGHNFVHGAFWNANEWWCENGQC